ncbi:MAG: hypothetical protein BAJALOKI3v1_380040 [Promethearchaeota archaeon]|nr:MAG: hypothetical protein BAJALOKI3v1_380040 [Candidatus Lokiarchaeota archaeon]
MEEIVMILQVLNRDEDSWATYHSYNDSNTQISFNWDPNDKKKIWVHIGEYSKMLDIAQIEILRLLLTHILKEKIEFATSSNGSGSSGNSSYSPKSADEQWNNKEVQSPQIKQSSQSDSIPKRMVDLRVEESIESINLPKSRRNKVQKMDEPIESEKLTKVMGIIKRETKKALLIQFRSGNEIWIPKSSIKSQYISNNEISQTFLIDTWVLAKNEVVSG